MKPHTAINLEHDALVPRPVPVLSLAIFRDESREELLLGVRRATATSPRHPGVLSTPTMRVPWSIMDAILERSRVELAPDEIRGMSRLQVPHSAPISVPNSMADPLSFAVEALLARKLGAADALVRGEMATSATASAVARALVDGCEMDEPEDTLMLTAEIVLESGAFEFPPTASFSRVDWVKTERLEDALRLDDPMLLISGSERWEVCLYGLCVKSAAFVVKRAA